MTSILIVALLAGTAAQVRSEPPAGYRYPTESDYSGDWKEYRQTSPVPFHASADFNGDGLADHAWLLLPTKGPGWALFMFLGSKSTSDPTVIKLSQDDRGTPAQRLGLSVVPPGTYDTACSKRYARCEAGEPARLRSTRPLLNFFTFESANSYFWWSDERKAFAQTWISD